MNFLKELNSQQRKAVLEEHNRVCVIAGAGCGKTKTLVSKLLFLLTIKNINPENILVLTFAKKAAQEIRDRVISVTGGGRQQVLYIYNFHSFCFFFLNQYSSFLGYLGNKFLIYNQSDQQIIVNKILGEEKIDKKQKDWTGRKKKINEVISSINNIKNKKIRDSWTLSKQLKDWFKEYQFFLQQNKALDFTDLLVKTISILSNFPEILQAVQKKFLYVLLDEAQDMNSLQWKIVELLVTKKEQQLFVVGDPNQAIYGFQGADAQALVSFSRNSFWKTIFLNVNYRSKPNIITLANFFVKTNPDLMFNQLLSFQEKEKKETDCKKNQNIFFFRRFFSIRKLIDIILSVKEKKNLKLNDIIVLYRNNYLSRGIEMELIKRRVAYEILGSFDYLEREEVKDVLSLFRVILYSDEVSLLRTLKWQEKLGKQTIKKIENLAREKEVSFLDVLFFFSQSLQEKKIRPLQREILLNFSFQVQKWKKLFSDTNEKNQTIEEFVWKFIEGFGYHKHLEKKEKNEVIKKKKNIEQFFNLLFQWRKKTYFNGSFGQLFHEFIQWVVVVYEKKDSFKERENLILSSIHQAKGLEFEVVFFVFLDEGTLPFSSCENLLEEKRLFYVGLTRAKQIIYLISNSEKSSLFLEKISSLIINQN